MPIKKKCFGTWKDADLFYGFPECRKCKLLESCKKAWINFQKGDIQ